MKRLTAFLCGLIAAFNLINGTNASAAFDDIGLGARAAAMGQAFSAVSNDANAINTNPAGLVLLKSPELAASYGKLYTGLWDDSAIGQGYFSLAFPVKKHIPGFMGVSWDELRLSDAYCETVFSGAYATTVSTALSVGASLKYLRKSYVSDIYTESDPLFIRNGYSKSGLGIDLGGLYRVNDKYTLALVLKNINQPDMGLGGTDRLPVQIRTGIAYWLKKSLVDLDISFKGGGYDVSIGAERVFQRKYLFRLGFLAGNDSKRNVALGLGSRFGAVNFDYSFTLPIGGISGTTGSHRLAFGFKFGAAEQAEEEARRADVEAIRNAQTRLSEQEKQIEALERKIKAQEELSEKAAAAAAVPQPAVSPEAVKVIAPEPAKAAPAIDADLELLKAELERSRKEADSFKERLISLEKKGKERTVVRPSAVQAPEGRIKAYLVQEGDTLESIAGKVYGEASKWPAIYKANAGALGRGGEVKPGQTLVIP
ncbi:MAG: LysM peptidoglycan-binding domain-containing protein [Elusimicrobia bacterium]|nr:LysM peptidoglycan-binding domain-containing protein [Elusimicrobiota bacterium]